MNWSHPEKELAALGVDTSRPGFYNEPEFLVAERTNPQLLELYAAFIRTRKFDTKYLERSARIITQAVEFLYSRLKATAQHGRCIDGSMVLMHFLEQQGIWSYATKGGMTVFFPESSGLPTNYFAPIVLPGNPALTGHSWLYAPPFTVADVSVRLQSYRQDEAAHLPDYVLSKITKTCRFDIHDLVETAALQAMYDQMRRLPTLQQVDRDLVPGILDTIQQLGPVEVKHEGARIRYVPSGASAPANSLEEWKNLVVDGKYPKDLYEEFVAELDE